MDDDVTLTSSALRSPPALQSADQSRPGSGLRLSVPVAMCLTLLLAPLLLVHPHHRVTLVSAASPPASRSHPAGVADAAPAVAAIPPSSASSTPASAAAAADFVPRVHIAAVSAASPVTSPPTSAALRPHYQAATTTTEAPSTTTTRPPVTTTTTRPPTTTTTRPSGTSSSGGTSHSETGSASWYQAPAGTCAHPSLPFGTVVTVTNMANGASTTCRVEDRGPYQGGRIIDLSEASFSQIASTSQGVIQVRITW